MTGRRYWPVTVRRATAPSVTGSESPVACAGAKFRALPSRELVAEHLEISPSELEVGLEVVAFSPFVPRLHEENTAVVWHAGQGFERASQRPPEKLWCRAMKHQSVGAASG